MTTTPLSFLVIALVLFGAVLLTVSMLRAISVYRESIQYAGLRLVLLTLNGVLLLGYVVYVFTIRGQPATSADLVASLALLISSVFVWTATRFTESVMEKLTRVAALERHRATRDDLTALPKRSFFLQMVNDAIAPGRSEPAALMIIDLNRFQWINDTRGHSYGDALLKEIALRLHRSIRKTDMLA